MERRLSELRPGQRGIIVRIGGPQPIKRRLLDMGLVKGTKIVVVRRAPLGDPVEFLLRGYNLSLRAREAEYVYVNTEKE